MFCSLKPCLTHLSLALKVVSCDLTAAALHADVAQADTMHKGVVQCTNYTAHLGRWAVPVTRDDSEYAMCGIDGCF